MSTRPRVYRAEGIVLRRRNIGEADSIFTVLATDGHKFEGVARGVRKSRSRMRGHLEPLTHSRFLLAAGKSLDVFTQAETVASFRNVREDLDRSAAAIYCAELCDRFAVEGNESRGLFQLFGALLTALEEGVELVAVRYFELHLLTLSGFELQLDTCAQCAGRLAEEATFFFSASAGGVVCRGCRAEAGSGRLLSLRALKVLRYARTCSLPRFADLTIDADLAAELESALAEAVVYQIDRQPSSRRFVDDLAALARRSSTGSATG